MRRLFIAALTVQCVAPARGEAQQLMTVRPLGPVTKVSPPGVLGSVSVVRALPGGRVLVSDIARRQVVLLDAEFHKMKAVIDSTTGAGTFFSGPMSGLLPFKGDSSLVVDPRTLTMLVIDANGEVARVMSVPSVRDAPSMVGGPFGAPGYDARGRIVFRGVPGSPVRPAVDAPNSLRTAKRAVFDDSAPVLRIDLATRDRETLAFVKIPPQVASSTYDKADQMSGMTIFLYPMPTVDDWALMPDGRVAVVRGRDYHVDWLELDGRWTSSEKVPYAWERLDDDAKQRMVDSVTAQMEKDREATRQKAVKASGTTTSKNPDVPVARQQVDVFRMSYVVTAAKELPDYRPAFKQGAARADAEGNLWVRTTTPSDAGPIYDVINAKGVLVDRVKLPYGRVISGFAVGIVYMGVLDDQGARLEMARIR